MRQGTLQCIAGGSEGAAVRGAHQDGVEGGAKAGHRVPSSGGVEACRAQVRTSGGAVVGGASSTSHCKQNAKYGGPWDPEYPPGM